MTNDSGAEKLQRGAGSKLLKTSRYYLLGLAVMPFLLALVAYFTSAGHVRSVARTLATDRFILSLDELLSTMQDAETGQRGYLLTGSDVYLTPYIRAKGELTQRFSEMATLASRARIEPVRLNELKAAVDTKMRELEITVSLYESGGRAAAMAEIRTNRGEQAMARIRRLIGQLKSEQAQAYERRYAQQVTTQRYLTAALGVVVALSIVLLILKLHFNALYARERDQTEAAIRRLNEELELRVQERTVELEARTLESEAQAVKLERSNADLAQFASIASHDLQEPLRMVVSYMGMLSRKYSGVLDETARTYIQYATTGAARMQTLVSDLLSYSHAGTQAITKQVTPAEKVCQRAVENLRLVIQENSAVVRFRDLPQVEVDEVKMTQVVQNLLGNAIKFRKPDVPPEITISAERRASDWLFSVSDNGIGFDSKYSDRIFQVFQRLHSVGRYPGNGIGLSICRRIVEHHGGNLWAESQPGVGSTFYFTLPFVADFVRKARTVSR
jgi:signal transduction histidine kinase